MDDGLAALLFSMNSFSKAHAALSAAKSAFDAACDVFDKASGEEEEVEVDEPVLEELSGRVAGLMPPFLAFWKPWLRIGSSFLESAPTSSFLGS